MSARENSQKNLRILSWNLYNRPWERSARMENVKRTLIERNPDLVALQEVSTGWLLSGNPMKIFEKVLAGFFSAHEWHESNAGVFKTGLGLFSRWPLKDVQYTEFKNHPFWDAKGFLYARVEIPVEEKLSTSLNATALTKSIHWFNVHLASTTDTEMQSKELDQFEAAITDLRSRTPEIPILISGDFNIEWKSPMLQTWLKKMQADSLFAHLPENKIHVTWSPDYAKTCAFAGKNEKGEVTGEVIDHIVWIHGKFMAKSPHKSPHKSEPPLKWISGGIGVSPLIPHPSDHCYVESTFQQ